jgi:ComF family protein
VAVAGWRDWLGLARPPGHCLVCHEWGTGVICQRCTTRWARPAPLRCQRCAINLRGLPHADGICMDCEAHSPEFDRALAALDYALPWSRLLARLKFQDACHLAPWLAERLAAAWRARPQAAGVILPMPISRARLRERGYNQSGLVAQALGARLGLPVAHDVLQRPRHTARLMQLDPARRQAEIAGALCVNPALRRRVIGRHVAVVDDVMTTGATLNEAALVLREAGARSVSAWVVARTARHPRNAQDFMDAPESGAP